LELRLVVGVVGVQAGVVALIFACFDGLFDLFSFLLFFLAELQIQSSLLRSFLHFGCKRSPGELDWDGTLVDDLVVLVGVERDGGGVGVDVGL